LSLLSYHRGRGQINLNIVKTPIELFREKSDNYTKRDEEVAEQAFLRKRRPEKEFQQIFESIEKETAPKNICHCSEHGQEFLSSFWLSPRTRLIRGMGKASREYGKT
jgi:CRISPR/Cas system CMR subunit Cmr6 (Cas7 group RAMP superfamily)